MSGPDDATPGPARRDMRLPSRNLIVGDDATQPRQAYASLDHSKIADSARFISEWRERRLQRFALPDGSVPQATIGASNRLPFAFLLRGARAGGAVGRITAEGQNYVGNIGTWHGTGFLVAPDVLLTNHHVLNTPEVCARSFVEFELAEGAPDDSDERLRLVLARFDAKSLFVTRALVEAGIAGLDYTFVRVAWPENLPPDQQPQPLTMPRASFLIDTGERANIVHHPLGEPKQVSLQDNTVARVDEAVLHYVTDTEAGSSGAPVFTNDWQLIGLHHASIKREGSHGPEQVNEGIRLAAIALDVELRLAAGHDRAADTSLAEVLELFDGTDSLAGYFGVLGRPDPLQRASGDDRLRHREDVAARVRDMYDADRFDLDVAFWDLHALKQARADSELHRRDLDLAQEIVADLNVDVWVLRHTDLARAQMLADAMTSAWGLPLQAVETDQADVVAVINRRTVERIEGPGVIVRLASGPAHDRHIGPAVRLALATGAMPASGPSHDPEIDTLLAAQGDGASSTVGTGWPCQILAGADGSLALHRRSDSALRCVLIPGGKAYGDTANAGRAGLGETAPFHIAPSRPSLRRASELVGSAPLLARLVFDPDRSAPAEQPTTATARLHDLLDRLERLIDEARTG